MNNLDAIAQLQKKARAVGRRFHVVSALATLAVAAALFGAFILVQWALMDVAYLKPAGAGALLLSIAVVPRLANMLLKRTIAARRTEWIDELSRTEGVDRATIETSFTVDSY